MRQWIQRDPAPQYRPVPTQSRRPVSSVVDQMSELDELEKLLAALRGGYEGVTDSTGGQPHPVGGNMLKSDTALRHFNGLIQSSGGPSNPFSNALVNYSKQHSRIYDPKTGKLKEPGDQYG